MRSRKEVEGAARAGAVRARVCDAVPRGADWCGEGVLSLVLRGDVAVALSAAAEARLGRVGLGGTDVYFAGELTWSQKKMKLCEGNWMGGDFHLITARGGYL